MIRGWVHELGSAWKAEATVMARTRQDSMAGFGLNYNIDI